VEFDVAVCADRSVFSQDRKAFARRCRPCATPRATSIINDKPTGAVVAQQPFGGARGSGTNDKGGSMLNLVRWVSARTMKENFTPRATTPTRSWVQSRADPCHAVGQTSGDAVGRTFRSASGRADLRAAVGGPQVRRGTR